MLIHPTAVIHPKATLADDVEVGPFCVIGEHVTIGKGTKLVAHVYLEGEAEIGERCQVYPYASIGGPPQHIHYKGEATKVIIGNDNVLREYVTVNRGTVEGGGLTQIGHNNFIMAYAHIAHDCTIGNHLIMANAASLAGHISIGDYAIIGGLVGIHQYVRIGAFSMVGGCSALGKDVPPFCRAAGGYRAQLYGLNIIGLKRQGFATSRISKIRKAYDVFFRSGHGQTEAIQAVRDQFGDNQDVMDMVDFVEQSKRGVCRSVGKDQEHEDLG